MTTTGWRVTWQTPVRVSVSPDHSSYEGISFNDSGATGIVQIVLGLDATVTLVTAADSVEIRGQDATGRVVNGVLEAVRSAGAPAAAPAAPDLPPLDLDETVITPFGATSGETIADNAGQNHLSGAGGATPPDDETAIDDTTGPDFDETVIGPGAGEPAATQTAGGAEGRPPRILRVEIVDADGPRVVELDGALYVGRAPRVPAERAGEPNGLAVVASVTSHVSATHLQLSDADGQLLARDLWSTNGTMLTPPRGAAYRLEPGETLPLTAGTRLTLADDVEIRVPTEQAGLDSEPGRAHRAQ